MRYEFDWDPAKERRNIRRHRVSFGQAASVFRDPNSSPDTTRSTARRGDRWITLGFDSAGTLRVVVHTFEEVEGGTWKIRVISARRATSAEARQYREMSR